MQAILKLDVAGRPRGWLSLQEAISAYARGDVIYGVGDPAPPSVWRRSTTDRRAFKNNPSTDCGTAGSSL
jgi:hypothetical protein